ncbi:hypothetical protein ACFYPC_34015 [Streptomyces sp. NPDC005808]|uniref:hypothetical protein n=1 Tax=Streptomyces sp. NPDC005808 TaxID=3364734 RepID=UPI003691BFEB
MLRHTCKNALRVVSPVAVLALTLSACGGGDDNSGADATKSSPPKATASQAKAASGGELGTEAEAAKLVQDPADAEGMILAVAHVMYTHTAGPALTSDSAAGDSTTIWADGKRGALLIFASADAPGCEDPYDIERWTTGETHTLCESYLVPSNATSVEVHWTEEAKGEDSEPYIWEFTTP